ncbi:MAG TPA: alpha/beta hydrolase [Terrimicrobiaceae bacterium]|nr:alpha/beta hydrolase [Terrimicrobiaceae bacterium]
MRSAVFAAFAALLFAAPAFAKDSGCKSAVIGSDSYCQLKSVRLHFIDHGGQGSVVILLAGLGSSAHVFDEFGPLLRHGHRVIAVTRRGYGQSSDASNADYSNVALVGDLLELMDHLAIQRASFVGHSLAGGELATLGAKHPERVDRLVYIDAAYDRSEVPSLMAALPPSASPSPTALATVASFTEWRQQALGIRSKAVVADVAATMQQGPKSVAPRTGQKTAGAALAGDIAAKARWEDIAAPSLAFYTSKDVAEQVPPEASVEQRQAFIDYSVRALRPWMLRQQAEFLSRRQCGTAVEVPRSTHHLFLERPAWLAANILAFLASPKPCASVFKMIEPTH